MYPSACLAIMDYSKKKAIWVGEFDKKFKSIEELRTALSRKQFRDNPAPIC